MNSYNEVRRVRQQMSDAAGHDIRKLIAAINERRGNVASRIIDPGTEAEQPDAGERLLKSGAVASPMPPAT